MINKITDKKLRDILVGPEYVSQADFNLAQKEAQKQQKDLREVLVEKNLIKDEDLGRLIAEELGVLFVDLKKERIDERVLRIIPEIVAKNQQVIAFDKNEAGLKIAMQDPGNYEMEKWLEKKNL